MLTKYYFFLLISFALFSESSTAQMAENAKSEFSYAIGVGLSDRRTDFLISNFGTDIINIAKSDKSWLEYEFFMTYNKKITNSQKANLYIGIGYVININLFQLPVNNSHFKNN